MLLGLVLVPVLGGALAVSGCKSVAPKTLEQKTFHLRGRIVAVDAAGGDITVAHQAIPGFMEAMTMSYKLVEPNTISELHVGDLITARMVVAYDAAGPLSPRLDQIVVVGQAKPDTKPTVSYHVPAPGDVVPGLCVAESEREDDPPGAVQGQGGAADVYLYKGARWRSFARR